MNWREGIPDIIGRGQYSKLVSKTGRIIQGNYWIEGHKEDDWKEKVSLEDSSSDGEHGSIQSLVSGGKHWKYIDEFVWD